MHVSRRSFSALLLGAGAAACGQAPPATTGAAKSDDERPTSYAKLNQPAAPFSLPKLNGGVASLADYAGKVVILLFGGLWCPDCVVDGAYTAHLSELADSDADVDFLEIHTRNRFGRWGPNEHARAGTPYNAEESASALHAYFAQTGHSYPVAFDASRDWAHENYAIEWYPAYLIVDRRGVIRAWRNDLFNAEGAESFFAEAKRIASAA